MEKLPLVLLIGRSGALEMERGTVGDVATCCAEPRISIYRVQRVRTTIRQKDFVTKLRAALAQPQTECKGKVNVEWCIAKPYGL